MLARVRAPASAAGLLLTFAACGGVGTDLNQLLDASATVDSGTTAGNPPPTSFDDPFASAPAYALSSQGRGGDDGSHNAGKSCMQSRCHGNATQHGGEAPTFLIGGTVYADYYGKTPESGVEVRIVGANGAALSTYSDRQGNFYIRSGQGSTITFPAVVGARNASGSRPMIRQLTAATMGSCGQSSCHIPGGSPTTGVYYPIHVP